MSGSTVLSVGGVNVSTSGTLTGAILSQLESLYGAGGPDAGLVVTVAAGAALPAPTGPNEMLVIPTADSGNISVPSGYAYVVYNGSGSVTGATGAVVIGDLNFVGSTSVVASDPTNSIASSINDNGVGVLIDVSGGAGNAVTASGAGQTINIDGSGSGTVMATGAGDTFNMAGGSYLLYALGIDTINQTAGSSTVSTSAPTVQMAASGGNVAFFAGSVADEMSTSGTTNLTYLGGGSDTIFAGGAADTVYAGSSMSYFGHTGSDIFVAGPTSAVTMSGAAQETIYANAGTSSWDLSTTQQVYFGAGGGHDAVTIGGPTAATLWGNNNESLSVIGSGRNAGSTTSSPPIAQIVGFGNNDNIDMTSSQGHDAVILWNANIGTSASPVDFTGNVTLTASSAGSDLVAMFAGSHFGTPADGNHTITVLNWQSNDIFDLSFAPLPGGGVAGYTAADAASANTQLASGSSFTLSDGTTVQFVGAKPTNIFHV